MSRDVYSPRIASLGPAHLGRKKEQPSGRQLKAFHRRAKEELACELLWFDEVQRRTIVGAIRDVLKHHRFTCYACAVLPDHLHLLIRRHRLVGGAMVPLFKQAIRNALRGRSLVPPRHPVFSADRRVFYKSTPQSVRNCIDYINRNFAKHGLRLTNYDFVMPYDDWPFHKRRCD